MEPVATYLSVLQKYKNNLKSITNDIDRREEYFRLYKKEFMWHGNDYAAIALNHLINDKDLFPSAEDKKYFLKNALNRSATGRLIIRQLHTSTFNIHEVIFEDGKSALHCLDEIYGSSELFCPKFETRHIIEYFFRNNPNKNYSDGHGYTYFHGACMLGQLDTVVRFLEQGVDANLDTYPCSPLHIAARYRREAIVKILLKHKANPNKPDHEQSTPLHALAYPCLCDCVCAWNFCHKRGPVVKIVKMLIAYGANINARNCHGDTPLQSAVSRFDTELTRALLKYGADLHSVNEDRMFSANFSSLELKCYPLTLDIIEVMKLLQSAGYEMNFLTKLKMIKFWIKARGNNIDRMIGDYTSDNGEDLHRLNYKNIVDILTIQNKFGYYMKQEDIDDLKQRREKLRPTVVPIHWQDYSLCEFRLHYCWCKKEKINIKITEDVSLHQLCRMNYNKGYSIIKNIENWHIPSMEDLPCERDFFNIFARRHIANILVRRWLNLEFLAADLFMTDYCSLNLPYVVCHKVAEVMSDEDLLHLFEKTEIENIVCPLSRRAPISPRVKSVQVDLKSISDNSNDAHYCN